MDAQQLCNGDLLSQLARHCPNCRLSRQNMGDDCL